MALLAPDHRADRAAAVAHTFTQRYDAAPEVVGVAPGRVNLIGEHTDYNHGLVLPVALPHATWVAVRRTETPRVQISSAQQDRSWSGSLGDLGPGRSDGWAAYVAGVVWVLQESDPDLPGLQIHVDSTVPVGAGLSSSAALECATAVAVTALIGRPLDDDRRTVLTAACIRAETEVAGAPTGGMDQTIAMRARPGHALLIDFDDDSRRQVPLALEADGLALLVTDTRVSHALVDGGYGDRRAECAAAAASLGVPHLRAADLASVDGLVDGVERRRARHVVTENLRVEQAVAGLLERDWGRVGEVMVASHVSMRDDFEISCAELDLAVATALDAGARGARMTGGGFGGSSVALVERARIGTVVAAIDAAFARAGYAAPAHLDAVPSDGAEVVHVDGA